MRLTLSDACTADARIATVLGLCAGDLPRIAAYINPATQELIGVASETGFWGGWDKLVFNVTCGDPYITLPAEYARLVNMDVCRNPIPIFNEWYEVLESGIGLQTPCIQGRYGCGIQAAFERATVPTQVELTATNQYLRIYITDARDIGKKILFLNALDSNGVGIYTTDVQHQINGFFIIADQPMATSTMIVTRFAAVQKPVTYGDVILKQVDATTGDEVQLARYTPKQTNPVYRRYYLQAFCRVNPNANPPTQVRQVTAMAKLEYRSVSEPTDLLIISNIPALKAKCEAIRLSEIDNPESQAMALLKHRQAVKMLSQELAHYTGTQPSVVLALQGTAKLERQRIGTLI